MRFAAVQIPSPQGSDGRGFAFVHGREQQLQPMAGDDWLGHPVSLERLGGKERRAIGDPPARCFGAQSTYFRLCPTNGTSCRLDGERSIAHSDKVWLGDWRFAATDRLRRPKMSISQ
jgi:hypothetical protein